MATGRFACTFSATPGTGFGGWTATASQSGCCLTTQGLIQTAYGIDPTTCNVLVWNGNSAPYAISQLATNSGTYAFTDATCSTFIDKVLNGVTMPGDGHSPNNKGSASQYGFTGCTAPVSSSGMNTAPVTSQPSVSTSGTLASTTVTATTTTGVTTTTTAPTTTSSRAAAPSNMAVSQITMMVLLLVNSLWTIT